MNSCKVIIVIPNWNLKEDLGECIDSLQLQNDHYHYDIVVVDNASTNGAQEYIRNNYPNVTLFSLDQNIGYAGALNIGIRYALSLGADYIFALNNDTIIPSGSIAKLVERMHSNTEIGILTPKVFYTNPPDRIYSLGSKSYSWLPLPIEFGRRWRDNKRYSGLMQFDYVTGCAMLIHPAVFNEVGLFNEDYFMYYEDNDFCRRVRDAGYRIACDGNAVIYHKASLSSKKQGDRMVYYRARNRMIFYHRYPHGPFRWLTWLTILVMAVWYSIGHLLKAQSSWLNPYWSGLHDGWKATTSRRDATRKIL